MFGLVDQQVITTAFREFLEAHSEHPVGDHRAPTARTDVLAIEKVPYSILYALPGGNTSGAPLGYADSDMSLEYQVTVVGLRRDQTQMLMQKIREVVLGREIDYSFKYSLTIPGIVVMTRELASPPAGVTLTGTLFNASESYFLKVGIEV